MEIRVEKEWAREIGVEARVVIVAEYAFLTVGENILNPNVSIIFNNTIRWNLDFIMVERGIKLHSVINMYSLEAYNYYEVIKRMLVDDRFDEDDWAILTC